MTDAQHQVRCQRCGEQMELRDPAPGAPWTPDQYWVCPRCGRHFWTTYPSAEKEQPKPAAAAKPAASDTKPAAQESKPAAPEPKPATTE